MPPSQQHSQQHEGKVNLIGCSANTEELRRPAVVVPFLPRGNAGLRGYAIELVRLAEDMIEFVEACGLVLTYI